MLTDFLTFVALLFTLPLFVVIIAVAIRGLFHLGKTNVAEHPEPLPAPEPSAGLLARKRAQTLPSAAYAVFVDCYTAYVRIHGREPRFIHVDTNLEAVLTAYLDEQYSGKECEPRFVKGVTCVREFAPKILGCQPVWDSSRSWFDWTQHDPKSTVTSSRAYSMPLGCKPAPAPAPRPVPTAVPVGAYNSPMSPEEFQRAAEDARLEQVNREKGYTNALLRRTDPLQSSAEPGCVKTVCHDNHCEDHKPAETVDANHV